MRCGFIIPISQSCCFSHWQKTIFRFFYKPRRGRREKQTRWTLHSTIVRACAAHCRKIDERPYCDAMFPNLTHPEQNMGGCVERHCCGDDLCNQSPETNSVTASFYLNLICFLLGLSLRNLPSRWGFLIAFWKRKWKFLFNKRLLFKLKLKFCAWSVEFMLGVWLHTQRKKCEKNIAGCLNRQFSGSEFRGKTGKLLELHVNRNPNQNNPPY